LGVDMHAHMAKITYVLGTASVCTALAANVIWHVHHWKD
jgi:hypothetical protein